MITPFGHFYRALIFDDEEEYEDYIAAATKNIQENASDYSSLNNRGVAYWERGDIQAALDDFAAASNLAPNESAPLLNRANILEHTDDLEGALAFATQAVCVAPNESTCYFVRRGIYQKLGDKIRAEEDHQNGNKCLIAKGNSIIEE